MRISGSFVRSLSASVVLILSTVSWSNGQDLSKYRSFQLGMNVDSVLAKIGMRRPDVRTIDKKPALIEALEWNPNEFSTQQTLSKSLSQIRFSFYNSELYKMVITYDYAKTDGLTTEDVIDAISAEYGKPTIPESSSRFRMPAPLSRISKRSWRYGRIRTARIVSFAGPGSRSDS